MILLETQQEMFVVFLGRTLKENEGLFLLSLSSLSGKDAPQPWVSIPLKWVLAETKRLFSAGWRLLQLKGWIGISARTFTHKTVTQLELQTQFWFETHTHSQQQLGSKISQKEVNNQTGNQNQCSVPPQRTLFCWLVVLVEVRGKTHTQSNKTQLVKITGDVDDQQSQNETC